jgi:hypothetical protein
MKEIYVGQNTVNYLNSGDWIESLTSLEYNKEQWRIFRYWKDFLEPNDSEDPEFEKIVDIDLKDLFKNMLIDFQN